MLSVRTGLLERKHDVNDYHLGLLYTVDISVIQLFDIMCICLYSGKDVVKAALTSL